jgi:hypothetical protein
VVAEQSSELEALESEQATLRATVQAVEGELGALRASHATLTAENGDLRMLCQEAGAKVRTGLAQKGMKGTRGALPVSECMSAVLLIM